MNYCMITNPWMIWLAIAVLLVIIEVLTASAIALCLAIGALAASISALVGACFELQLLVLAVAMLASLVFVPRLLKRYKHLFKSGREAVSNMDALMGREAVVEAMPGADNAVSRVKIDGDRWQVKSVDGSELELGDRVKVCGYDSIILIVKKI